MTVPCATKSRLAPDRMPAVPFGVLFNGNPVGSPMPPGTAAGIKTEE